MFQFARPGLKANTVLHKHNFGLILKGIEGRVDDDLNQRGARIASAAGHKYESKGHMGKYRYRTTVRSLHPTHVSEAKSVLLAAVDAGKTI